MTPEVLARIRAVKRASQVLRAGAWCAADAIDRVVLDADERFRRRIVLTGESGSRFLLDFAEATPLRDGDGLLLDDGTIVAVTAKPELLVDVSPGDGWGDGATGADALARLAWHLGNRHTEVEIARDKLRMRRDHVLEDMLARLGAVLTLVEAPFEPERGSYRHGHGGGDGGLAERSASALPLPAKAGNPVTPEHGEGHGASAPSPPLGGEGRGEGGARQGQSGSGDGSFSPAWTCEAAEAGQQASTRGAPPSSHPSPPKGGEGAGCDKRPSLSSSACVQQGQGQLPAAALYRLLTWISPAYPVGAFSYSSGLEWAVEAGDVRDAPTLTGWLMTMIGHGSVSCDAAIFCHAHRAAADGDDGALAAAAELAAALAGSRERFLETTAQGQAFLQITQAAWATPALERLAAAWDNPLAHPVAVAAACAGHGIALKPALHAFLHGVVSNLVSAGVRLVPLGQTDGQRVLAALEASIAEAAERAVVTGPDDIGMAALRADIASMRHETQYTRLFRS
jgi:urease accessory protein